MKHFLFLIITLLFISCHHKKATNKKDSDAAPLIVNFTKPEGKSFQVSDVELADSFLNVDTAKNVFENKIDKEIVFYPEEYKHYGLVNCPNNGLIQTLQQCYDNHRPLILTPDIIWLAICQGVSIQINEKFDSLKNIIFVADKPSQIVIRNDSLEYKSIEWAKLVGSFSKETKKYTRDDYYSFFVSNFSTTTDIEKAAYQITLLESYKKAFEYIGETGCGIPRITLTGKKEDWQMILKKLEMLDNLGLGNWGRNLKPLIKEFINVYDGNINTDFWQSIYKNASEYSAYYISGWIIKFFPYTKELEEKSVFDKTKEAYRVGEFYKPNVFMEGNRYLLSTLSTDNFPSGIAKIDVTWNNYKKHFTKKMEVYAGFFAIKQYEDKTLEPLISWAVCEKKGKKPAHIIHKNKDLILKHTHNYWSPKIADSLVVGAIYDIKHFKTQKASFDFIKATLLDSIKSKPEFVHLELKNDTIEGVVLTDGTLSDIRLKRNNNLEFTEYIKTQLNLLPEKWFPALAHPQYVLEDDYTDEQAKLKVRANSRVKIGF